jgi:arylsulfatase A-like enzyme
VSPGSSGGLPGGKKRLSEGGLREPGILEWPARIPKPFVTSMPVCTTDFYPTTLDLLGIKLSDQIEPIDGISLLPLIDGTMERRPKPIPFLAGNQTRLIDNQYTLVNGRLFRFAEGGRKDVDITDQEPEVLKRMTHWMNEWKASVKKDQAAYSFKRR